MQEFNKRGNILTENIIFIILNIIFLTIIILFVYTKMNSAYVMEEIYAKQIALMLDASSPESEIVIDMSEAFDQANSENYAGKIINIQDNVVTVKLREKGGYSYSFFNNLDMEGNYYPDFDKKSYIFKIISYKENAQ